MGLAQALKITVTPEPKGTHRDTLARVLRRFREIEDGEFAKWEKNREVVGFKTSLNSNDQWALKYVEMMRHNLWMRSRWTERIVSMSTPPAIFNGTVPFIASFLELEENEKLRVVMGKVYPIRHVAYTWPIEENDPIRGRFEAEVKQGQWPFGIIKVSASGLILLPEIVGIEVLENGTDKILQTITFYEKPKMRNTVYFGVDGQLYQDTGVLQTEIFESGAYSLRFTRESEAAFLYTARFEGEMTRLPPVDEIMASKES